MKILIRIFIILTLLIITKNRVYGQNGKSLIIKHKCATCHKFKGPASQTIAELLKKRAPDLFYAGLKFQREFLVKFLQKPIQIRPAGTVYVNNIKFDGQVDEIKNVEPCKSKLSPEDAEIVTSFLMKLKGKKMNVNTFKPQRISMMKARIIFEKNEACHACHKIKNRGMVKGGNSAPVLYNAGARLNGDWIYSYIKNPQYWDPKIWMPKKDISEDNLQLLINYMINMKG